MNQKQRNFEMMKHPGTGLKDSVDSLRTCVKDLYELDEDNYQMIQNLRKALDESNNRVNGLNRRFNKVRKLTGLGLITLGIGGVLLNKVLEYNQERIHELEEKIRVLMKPEEKEESDG